MRRCNVGCNENLRRPSFAHDARMGRWQPAVGGVVGAAVGAALVAFTSQAGGGASLGGGLGGASLGGGLGGASLLLASGPTAESS